MKEYVLVPQADIYKLEEARKRLVQWLGMTQPFAMQRGDFVSFTEPIRKITNTEYRSARDYQEAD